jgi:8-oxo-dGTP pyrophosphatase MutT (NUDIX family)
MLHFDANAPVVPARLAATLLLLRDGDQGLEVFVMRRHERSGFLGGAVVFPGGKVESYDWLESPMSELSRLPFLNSRQFGEPREVLACAIAAVRESLEEAGILALGGLPSPTDSEIRTLRETLVAAPDTFLELVQGRELNRGLFKARQEKRWCGPIGLDGLVTILAPRLVFGGTHDKKTSVKTPRFGFRSHPPGEGVDVGKVETEPAP